MCEVHHTPKWGNRASTRHAGCEMGYNQAADIVFYGCPPSPDACGRPTSAPVSSSMGGQPPSPLLGARPITASNRNSLVLRDTSKLCHIATIGRLRVRSTLKTRGSRYGIYKLDPFIGSVSSPDFIHERGGSNPVGGAQPLRRSHSEACTADPSIRVATRMLFCCECLLQRN